MLVEIHADIVVEDASVELLDVFTDLLMDELLARGAVDPTVGGALARGEVDLVFAVEVESWAEGATRGPGMLIDVVKAAGVEPKGPWTDVPGMPLRGELRILLEKQALRLVRHVSSDLIDA